MPMMDVQVEDIAGGLVWAFERLRSAHEVYLIIFSPQIFIETRVEFIGYYRATSLLSFSLYHALR